MTYMKWLLALAFALPAACATSSGGGTQTNWITCHSDVECPSNLSCVENRCTATDARANDSRTPLSDARPRVDDAPGKSPEGDARVPDLTRSSLGRASAGATPETAVTDAVAGNTAFALALYEQLRGSGGNVVFSPLSITLAMGMAWAGARGETVTEIAQVFHFGEPEATHAALNALEQRVSVRESQLVVQAANAWWISPELNPLTPYLDTLATDYGAGVGLVDFGDPAAAADRIDAWVSQQTNGTIPRLLEAADLSGSTTSVLTNALYFDARWATPFDKTYTADEPFQTGSGSTSTVKMMHEIVQARYAKAASYQAAAVPYRVQGGKAFELLVILPDDLATFESQLDPATLDDVSSTLRSQEIDLAVPRATLRSSFALSKALTDLGMPVAFSGLSDFSLVSDPPPGKIDEVIHQGYLSLTESGTEASAATGVVFADGSAVFRDTPPPLLQLDHPFLAFVRSVDTGALLFVARVAEL